MLCLRNEWEPSCESLLSILVIQVIRALVPSDPLDSCDVLLEVVSGRTTGGLNLFCPLVFAAAVVLLYNCLVNKYVFVVSGDICQQFTREMFEMYQGFAAYKNWDFEILNYTHADYGQSGFSFSVCW